MKEKENGLPETSQETSTEVRKEHCENTKYLADYKKVFEYFKLKTATMFQCEIELGIPRPYICWYVRSLRKNKDIQIARFGTCPISRYKGVQFLTTDKSLFKDEIQQPTLFDEL
jgi:hypothetical protein